MAFVIIFRKKKVSGMKQTGDWLMSFLVVIIYWMQFDRSFFFYLGVADMD
jgi:hypothetical protein